MKPVSLQRGKIFHISEAEVTGQKIIRISKSTITYYSGQFAQSFTGGGENIHSVPPSSR